MKKIALFSVFYVCWFIASDQKATQVPARVLPLNVPSQESVERLQDAIATLPSSYFPLIDNQDLDRIFDLPIAEYKSNESINALLQQNHDIEQYLNPRQRFALQYYLHNTLASGISDLDLERVEFALQYFNQDQLNQHHPAILFEIARLDNLTEDQETIRRQIFVKLLQAGADPFPVWCFNNKRFILKRSADYVDDRFRELNFNKDLCCNIFTLPNVLNDIDLITFLFEACKAYTKSEYKHAYRAMFNKCGNIWLINLALNNLIADLDINSKNMDKDMPLHIFLEKRAFLYNKDLEELKKTYPNIELLLQKILELYIQSGADMNAQNIIKRTPLHIAANFANTNIIELLLKHGANPNAQDSQGETPLYLIHNEDSIPLFVKYGANLNVQNNKGDTMLHQHAYYGLMHEVRLLLEYGADPLITNKKGKKPSDVVPQHYQKLTQLLQAAESEKPLASWMQTAEKSFGRRKYLVNEKIALMLKGS